MYIFFAEIEAALKRASSKTMEAATHKERVRVHRLQVSQKRLRQSRKLSFHRTHFSLMKKLRLNFGDGLPALLAVSRSTMK